MKENTVIISVIIVVILLFITLLTLSPKGTEFQKWEQDQKKVENYNNNLTK